jgi:hypothetical protein
MMVMMMREQKWYKCDEQQQNIEKNMYINITK